MTYELIDGLSVSANLSRYFTSYFADSRIASGTLELASYGKDSENKTSGNSKAVKFVEN